MRAAILPIDPATYVPHALHREERSWPETNCYVDLWIELLHGLGLDPVAAAAFTLALDFEGDQWTFFKFPLADLYALYGIDVQELNVWSALEQHVLAQLRLGRPVIVEVDACFLPDTAGTAYGAAHTKTSVAVQAIDVGARQLGYFHNAGYHVLEGDDFDGIFRLGGSASCAAALPPYAELAKLDRLARRPAADLARIALELTRAHLARRPAINPVAKYRPRFRDDIAWLAGNQMAAFHQYAFATLRQCGACSELAATFVRWLGAHGESGLDAAAADLETIATTAKALQFRTARIVSTKKAANLEPMLDTMEASWDSAMARLVSRYGG